MLPSRIFSAFRITNLGAQLHKVYLGIKTICETARWYFGQIIFTIYENIHHITFRGVGRAK